MKLLVVRLGEGDGEVVFESSLDENQQEDGLGRVRGVDVSPIEKAQELGAILSKVSPVVRTLRDALNDLNNPSEITVEFGLKIGGRAGLVFSSVDAEANFKVVVKWSDK